MADLLECVIQIKALADTPRRLSVRLKEARARGPYEASFVLHHVLVYEAWLHACIEAALAADGASLPAQPGGDSDTGSRTMAGSSESELLRLFTSRREDIVRRLETCSAAELGKVGMEPRRGPTTVADLVALALAHDTDAIAKVVRGQP